MIKEIGNSPGQPANEEEMYEHPYEIESSAYKFAREELLILCKLYPTKDNPPIVKGFIHEILALVDKFGHSPQSGGSAPLIANAIADTVKKLCTFQPLCPITGFDEEWAHVVDGLNTDDIKYQNKRLSSVFKSDSGVSWYLNAITWKTQNGNIWHSKSVKLPSGDIIGSSLNIKSFPFTPKTFTIDVIETEIEKDNWEFTVKNEDDLIEVFEYYNPLSKH